ncbi:MAG: hypothetical protein KDA94_06955, partial [Acidimicrobiales bacterium]|nr:hypothetical protein [Acidimicrobiales bacterium]
MLLAAGADQGFQFETIDVYLIVAVAFLLILAALAAIAETSVVRISKAKAKAMAEEGGTRERALL